MMNLEEYAGGKFPIAETGDYEVEVFLEKTKTKDGSKEYLNLKHRIRDDVNQRFGGTYVFDKAWVDKSNPQWFDLRKLGTLLVTQKEKADYHKDFEDVDELIQYLNGCHCIVHVEKLYDDEKDEYKNEIKYLSYLPSKWDNEDHPTEKNESKNLDSIQIDDDEVPF